MAQTTNEMGNRRGRWGERNQEDFTADYKVDLEGFRCGKVRVHTCPDWGAA